MVAGLGRNLHIVRAVVEVSEVSWVVEVIFMVAGGRQWRTVELKLTSISWSAELMYARTTGRV